MQKVVLKNGLTILYQPKPGAAVVVEVMVKVGSNNEGPNERGLSHFLEHILFEGTVKRPTNRDIANAIESVGGEFNAYTTTDRTCFYIKVLRKHLVLAIEILADIVQYPLLNPSDITKEKKVVLKEIDMVFDDPRFYQWILLQQHLFVKHPSRFPTYGNKKVIRLLTPQKVRDYFQKYYVPQNMVVTIVGDVANWKQEIESRFVQRRGGVNKKIIMPELPATKNTLMKEKRHMANTYCVMGFKTVARGHADSYVLEVINGILGRGQSGKMFTEIRGKRGLAYEVGTQSVGELTSGYFAVYASIDKKNLSLVKRLMQEELDKLQKTSAKDLQEAQEYIEGDYLLDLEDHQKLADQILYWQQIRDAQLMKTYLKNIKKVTLQDVRRVAKKYFKYHTLVVLEGK